MACRPRAYFKFLIAMPIVMKMETLEVPRKLDDQLEMPDPNASQLTITVHADTSMTFNDGDRSISAAVTFVRLRTISPHASPN